MAFRPRRLPPRPAPLELRPLEFRALAAAGGLAGLSRTRAGWVGSLDGEAFFDGTIEALGCYGLLDWAPSLKTAWATREGIRWLAKAGHFLAASTP